MHDDYDVEEEHGGKDPTWRTKDGRLIPVSRMRVNWCCPQCGHDSLDVVDR